MKVTLPVFLHAQELSYDNEATGLPYAFSAFSFEMASAGYIPLGRSEVEFELPTADQIVARHAVLLRIKIAEVREKAEMEVNQIREQLSKLESLTYTPPAAKEPTDVP